MNIFSFTENSTDVFYIQPDTSICKERKSDNEYIFYTPDAIKDLIAVPIVYVKIDKPCKSVLSKFANRHYHTCGYGIHLTTNDIIEGCIIDNSTFLSQTTNIIDEQINGKNDIEKYKGLESFNSAIERASKYVSLRMGDIIALELPPLLKLTIEEYSSQSFEYQELKIKVIG